MSTPDVLYTKGFWLGTFALCIHSAAITATGVLSSAGVKTLHDVPWDGVVSSSGFAALYTFLAAVGLTSAVNSDTVAKLRERKGRHAKPE